jgi:hypothetical protein
MAKKSTAKGATKAKTVKKKAGKKRAGKKKAAKKPAVKKPAVKKPAAKKPLLAIDAMPESRQTSVYDAVQNLLANRGVRGQLTAIHLDTDVQPLLCQPPKARRMVCRKIDGIVRCAPECVDP